MLSLSKSFFNNVSKSKVGYLLDAMTKSILNGYFNLNCALDRFLDSVKKGMQLLENVKNIVA